MCDHCRAISYLSHPITGCTLTRLTGAGQSPFCSLAVTVRHVPRERWLEMFWILLIRSRYRSAHWDLWNRTIGETSFELSEKWDLYDLFYNPRPHSWYNHNMVHRHLFLFTIDKNHLSISLAYWDRGQIAAISQTIFWNVFSWMKMYEFRLRFHWNMFLRFELTIVQHWFR